MVRCYIGGERIVGYIVPLFLPINLSKMYFQGCFCLNLVVSNMRIQASATLSKVIVVEIYLFEF